MANVFVILWAVVAGLIASAPIELPYKFAVVLLPAVVIFFALRPFLMIMSFLMLRPELELFSDTGLLKYFSVVPIFFLFVFMGIKKIDFCWGRLKYFYVLLFFSILSIGYAADFTNAVVHVLRLISIVCIYLFIFNFSDTEDDLRKILFCFPLASLIPLVIGGKQFLLQETYLISVTQMVRVEGLFVLANAFAEFLFVVLVASVPLLSYERRLNFLWAPIIFADGLMILFLKVRSVVVVCALAAFCLFCLIREVRIFVRKFLLPILLAAVCFLAPMIYGMFERFIHPVKDVAYGGDSLLWRFDLWRQLFYNGFLKKPLFGYGAGGSPAVTASVSGYPYLPHNDYLRILIENGVFGFIFYLSFFISYLRYCFVSVAQEEQRYLNVCAMALLISYLALSFVGNVFYNVTYFWYFFGFLAIVHKWNILFGSRHQRSL